MAELGELVARSGVVDLVVENPRRGGRQAADPQGEVASRGNRGRWCVLFLDRVIVKVDIQTLGKKQEKIEEVDKKKSYLSKFSK